MSEAPALVWFQHDLRIVDNPALVSVGVMYLAASEMRGFFATLRMTILRGITVMLKML